MWLLSEGTVKMQLKECCFHTLRHQLLIFTGFSPSQGKEREEEVKSEGRIFLQHLSSCKQQPKTPLGLNGASYFLVACPLPWIASWFSELPQVGGRILS